MIKRLTDGCLLIEDLPVLDSYLVERTDKYGRYELSVVMDDWQLGEIEPLADEVFRTRFEGREQFEDYTRAPLAKEELEFGEFRVNLRNNAPVPVLTKDKSPVSVELPRGAVVTVKTQLKPFYANKTKTNGVSFKLLAVRVDEMANIDPLAGLFDYEQEEIS